MDYDELCRLGDDVISGQSDVEEDSLGGSEGLRKFVHVPKEWSEIIPRHNGLRVLNLMTSFAWRNLHKYIRRIMALSFSKRLLVMFLCRERCPPDDIKKHEMQGSPACYKRSTGREDLVTYEYLVLTRMQLLSSQYLDMIKGTLGDQVDSDSS